MYHRMLVPLDGSELAEVALTYARELASRLGIDVILLNVYSLLEQEMTPMHRAYVERAAEVIRQQSEGAQSGGGVIEARGELVMGSPAEEILRYADENDIDFILMATRGRSGISRWAMGSLANKVLQVSRVPVWLVRAEIPEEIVYSRWPWRTILVPLDGSELAELVLPHVEKLAKQGEAGPVEVVLLTVYESPVISSDYPPDMPLSWEKHVERENAKCRETTGKYLAGVEKRLKAAGLKVRSEVLLGKPADEIIDYSSKNPVNLIAMATHGRSGISRWAYGSVAEKVLLGVSTPLFLVRPR